MNDFTTEEGIPEGQEDLEDVSPSFKGGKEKPKPSKSKEKAAKKATGDVGDKVVKKGAKQLALAAAKAVAAWVSSAASAIAGVVGWPVFVGCLVVFLIIMIIFGGLLCLSINRYFGGSLPEPAGKNDPNVQYLVAASNEKAKGDTYKFELPNQRDQEYLASGQIDKRLAAALAYLVKRHEHIRVSHIVSGYEDMKVNPESGAFHDIQIAKNISAHKRGEAADVDEIDYVQEKCKCGSDTPVQVAWQTIGENPFETAPDVLQDIKSPADLAQEQIKEALQKLGVQGLDQPDLASKLQTISGITSVFDLTKPSVIDALMGIGITGIDNDNLQDGIKRLQAIQEIYNLSPQDLNALTSGQGANLLSQIGINITDETKTAIEKYQQAQVLQNITSIEDLNNPEVQKALQAVDIDPNDPAFKTSLEQITAANKIMNWQGDFTDPGFQNLLTTLNISMGSDLQTALTYYQAFKDGLQTAPGEIIAEPAIYSILEKNGITLDNPDAQQIFSYYRAFSQIDNWQATIGDAVYQSGLAYIGANLSPETRDLYEKYQAAQYIANFQGSPDDPRLQAAMEELNVNPAMLDTLRTYDTLTMLVKTTNVKDLFPQDFQKLQDMQTILNIQSLSDLNSSTVQQALSNFNININDEYQDIVNLSTWASLLNKDSLQEFGEAFIQQAANNLNISPEIARSFGYVSDIQTLANIRSPWDLTRPDVQQSLANLNINIPQETISQAGSVYALTQIRNPEDLLKPETLQALDNLNIIKVDSELMGQIGAVQTLLQIRSIEDLFNPNTILALNTLSIISLTNPVVAALQVVSMFSSFLGINLFGLGGCQGNTDCYKPTAQANVHTVISQLLQFPYDEGKPDYYSVTQLITYSEERDVLPFADQLDKLYGSGRPNNLGLFAMPEASDHIHIGY